MARRAAVASALLLLAPATEAFAPSAGIAARLGLRSNAAVSRRANVVAPRMAMDVNHIAESAQSLLAAVPNVPFVDEVTGEAQGFTAPKNHFASVIGLWVLFALPVWSAAYKQAGCDTPDWFGVSQVAEDAPGIGLVAKAAPVYDGPSFREGLEYVLSFLWKPPILIAWRPRADLDRANMDPARDTVVSSIYKSLGGALDKTAIYDEEDQLLILSDIEEFPSTPLGDRRFAIAEANGWMTGNPSFGKSLIEFSEETRKGKKQAGTVTISAEELQRLRAEAAKMK
uniref:Uncharacterized protein n=1 Tax=Hanusia phi TaxID=3032 RepID=A0A7S0EIG5_9CRYP